MSKIAKYILIALGILILVAAAIAAYVAATFDPNAYKPKIIQLVKEKTQRTLAIPGDIKLSFFPRVAVSLGKVSLSEPGSGKVFASVDELRVSLGLMPLLRNQIRADDVFINGLNATLVRYRDGRTNIDDLLGTEAKIPAEKPAAPPAALPVFDVSSITLERSAVAFLDEKANATYAVSDLDVKTGRIANDTPSTIELSAKVQATQPKVDVSTQLKSGFQFDLREKRYSLKDIALEVKGAAADVSNLSAKVQGSADADMKTPAIDVSKLNVAATGNRGEQSFDVEATLPRLKLTKEKVEGEQLTVKSVLKSAGGTTNANVAMPKLEGSAKAFRVADLALDLDAVRPDQTLKARITGPVEGQLDEATLKPARISVNPLGVQATLSGPHIPNKAVSGDLKGSAVIDVAKERVNADLAGTFDQSNIKAKVGGAGFTSPGYTFDVDVDKLDLTRYQPPPKPPPQQTPTVPAAKPGPEEAIDLSALKQLNANGSIRIGSLTAQKIKAQNVRIEVKAQGGRVNIDPMAANLYGGSLNGAIGVNAQATPQFSVRQNLTGVNVGPLLADAANFQRLEGRGTFALNVTTAGQTVNQLKKGLSGTAAANLADGAIRGVNIAATIREAKETIAQLKGQQQTTPADTSQKTDFAALKATFNIHNGVASNRDLVLTSTALQATGEGVIDLANDRMNYLLKARVPEAGSARIAGARVDLAQLTIPVRVTGPLNAPTYQFDFAGVAAGVAEQAVKEQIEKKLGEKLPGGAGNLLQDAVKGLFKR